MSAWLGLPRVHPFLMAVLARSLTLSARRALTARSMLNQTTNSLNSLSVEAREPLQNIMDKEHIRLIQLYGGFRLLWDILDPEHLNKSKRRDCWNKIAQELKAPVPELKKRLESLIRSYRREKRKFDKSKLTASGPDEIYVSKWFAYKYFDFMTKTRFPTRNTKANVIDISATELPQISHTTKKPISHKRIQEEQETNTPKRSKESDQNENNRKDIESDIYCQLLAHKIKKLGENDRLRLMNDIDNLTFKYLMEGKSRDRANAYPPMEIAASSSQLASPQYEASITLLDPCLAAKYGVLDSFIKLENAESSNESDE